VLYLGQLRNRRRRHSRRHWHGREEAGPEGGSGKGSANECVGNHYGSWLLSVTLRVYVGVRVCEVGECITQVCEREALVNLQGAPDH